MDNDIKTKWIAALKSGNYKQGSGTLRSDKNEFCCLGVLCDVVDPSGWCHLDKDTPDLYYHLGTTGTLSQEMKRTYGLSSTNVGILIDLNDNQKLSFTEIAEYIEKEL